MVDRPHRPVSIEVFRGQVERMTLEELEALASILKKSSNASTDEIETVATQIAKLHAESIKRHHWGA